MTFVTLAEKEEAVAYKTPKKKYVYFVFSPAHSSRADHFHSVVLNKEDAVRAVASLTVYPYDMAWARRVDLQTLLDDVGDVAMYEFMHTFDRGKHCAV